jgi:nucleoside-diphosphate-sugar epimerase
LSEALSNGHVLVTGGAGYIGAVLTEALLEQGYEVTVLDRFFFGDTLGDLRSNARLHLVKDDVRTVTSRVFTGISSVFDLAALSNDPAGELNPEKTLEINYRGRARVCRLAKEMGVKRYVLASSCSIYGFQNEIVDETSKINPLTTYAKANALAEQSNLSLADQSFTVTALRQATVYGLSRRMRFDLAINGMVLSLFKQGSVKIMRDGLQWRPMVHVRDTSQAFMDVMEASPDEVSGEIFNVGSEEQNLQIYPLAERLSKALGLPFREDWYGDPDHRSYRVSFKKIEHHLGYKTRFNPEEGARDIFAALKSGQLVDGPKTRTVEWYKSLIEWHEATKDVVMNGSIL